MNLHKQGKVWGSTQPLFNKNNVEIHRIETKKGGYCSKHMHEFKHNCFFVESGKLKITAWKNDYDLVDVTILIAGEATTVPPREYHTFECLEDCVCYEIYWVEISTSDIVRENHGGTEK
jgi:quercetin dioxygenase-like cupin family protein